MDSDRMKLFHSFAFEVACMSALEEELESVINDIETMPEGEFKSLIQKYPDILKLNFQTEDPKNGIIHRIDTVERILLTPRAAF